MLEQHEHRRAVVLQRSGDFRDILLRKQPGDVACDLVEEHAVGLIEVIQLEDRHCAFGILPDEDQVDHTNDPFFDDLTQGGDDFALKFAALEIDLDEFQWT